MIPTKIIGFFSSDAREKYKADVFRALALPNKYVIHFRYQDRYIQPELLSNLDDLKGKEGVIFYVSGNDLDIPAEKREMKFLSIRNVKVRDVFVDDNQNLVNFNLELGAFTDCSFAASTPKQATPPYLSVSELDIDSGPKTKWHDRVDLFKPHLPNTLYYMVSAVREGKRVLVPEYSEDERESYYALNDESAYQVDFSLYDPSSGDYGLDVQTIGDNIDLNIPSGHKMGAPRETSTFRLNTHTLPLKNAVSFSRLSVKMVSAPESGPPGLDLSVQVRWNIAKKLSNIVKFGGLTVLGAIGLMGAGTAFKDLATANLCDLNWGLALVSVVMIGLAAGLLYWMFNKK